MFASSEIKDVFPTPIWVADLEPETARNLNIYLRELIYRLTEPRREIPLGGTWQTEPMLHQREDFKEFSQFARQAASAALTFLQIEHDGFEISGCWANINPRGGLNSPHTHPNNYLSGVYYVSLPPGTKEIVFADPRSQSVSLIPPVKKWNKYIGNEVRLDLREGRFVLFPSWLVHSVPVNRSDAHRVSISFNIMFSNFTETMSRPLWKGTARIRD